MAIPAFEEELDANDCKRAFDKLDYISSMATSAFTIIKLLPKRRRRVYWSQQEQLEETVEGLQRKFGQRCLVKRKRKRRRG
jgi:hypothetical protein